MRGLLTSLNDHPIALLRGIAELRGLTLTSNVRAEAAAQLAAALAEPAATASALATCSAPAQTAWRALLAAGRRMKSAIFARAYGEIRPIGPGRLERESVWQQPANAAEELWYRGLIFRAFADFGDGPLEYLFIPDDLPAPPELSTAAAAGPGDAPPDLPAAAEPAPPRQAFNSLAVDLCAALATLRDTPAALERAGDLRASEADRLRAGLLLPDPLRLDLLLAVGRGRGWLAVDRERLTINFQSASAWLRATPWEQMTALFKAWRDSVPPPPPIAGGRPGEITWNDLRRIPTLQAEGNWQNDPGLARRAVLGSLARVKPGVWYVIADLVGWLKATNPDFQRPDGDYTAWYLRDAATGRYLSGFESWDEVEGRLIRFLITGPLFWLGAVALSGEGAGQEAFRVTQLGAAWLNDTLPAALPRPTRLTVGEDFIVTAPMLCPLLDRFRLLRFTDPEPSPNPIPALGRATRHRIHRSSLARARSNGIKPEAVLDFLRHATHDRVPSRVSAGLMRWAEQTRAATAGPRGEGIPVRITRGAVLRVTDAAALAALRADPVVAPLLGELLSAQAVLVKEAHLPRLLAALTELGYTARVE